MLCARVRNSTLSKIEIIMASSNNLDGDRGELYTATQMFERRDTLSVRDVFKNGYTPELSKIPSIPIIEHGLSDQEDKNIFNAYVREIKRGDWHKISPAEFGEKYRSEQESNPNLLALVDDLVEMIPVVEAIRDELHRRIVHTVNNEETVLIPSDVLDVQMISDLIGDDFHIHTKVIWGTEDYRYLHNAWGVWEQHADEIAVKIAEHVQSEEVGILTDDDIVLMARNKLMGAEFDTVFNPVAIRCLRKNQLDYIINHVERHNRVEQQNAWVLFDRHLEAFVRIESDADFYTEGRDKCSPDSNDSALIEAWEKFVVLRDVVDDAVIEQIHVTAIPVEGIDGYIEGVITTVILPKWAKNAEVHPIDVMGLERIEELKRYAEEYWVNSKLAEKFQELLARVNSKNIEADELDGEIFTNQLPDSMRTDLRFAYLIQTIDIEPETLNTKQKLKEGKKIRSALKKIVGGAEQLSILEERMRANEPIDGLGGGVPGYRDYENGQHFGAALDNFSGTVTSTSIEVDENDNVSGNIEGIATGVETFLGALNNVIAALAGTTVGSFLMLKKIYKTGDKMLKARRQKNHFEKALEEAKRSESEREGLVESLMYGLQKVKRKFFTLLFKFISMLMDIVLEIIALICGPAAPVSGALMIITTLSKMSRAVEKLGRVVKGAYKRVMNTAGVNREKYARALVEAASSGSVVAANLLFKLKAHEKKIKNGLIAELNSIVDVSDPGKTQIFDGKGSISTPEELVSVLTGLDQGDVSDMNMLAVFIAEVKLKLKSQ